MLFVGKKVVAASMPCVGQVSILASFAAYSETKIRFQRRQVFLHRKRCLLHHSQAMLTSRTLRCNHRCKTSRRHSNSVRGRETRTSHPLHRRMRHQSSCYLVVDDSYDVSCSRHVPYLLHLAMSVLEAYSYRRSCLPHQAIHQNIRSEDPTSCSTVLLSSSISPSSVIAASAIGVHTINYDKAKHYHHLRAGG